MKVKDIAKVIENFAPKVLKESYDNVGLMVGDMNKDVKKVMLSLDCKLETIKEAQEKDIDLIITHHPLIFRKPSRIVKGDLQGEKIIELIKSDISLYSCHTNLDSACNGINDHLVKMLGFCDAVIMDKCKIDGCDNSGIGRIVTLNQFSEPIDIINIVKSKLNISKVRAAIGNKKIKKIAIINGSGQDFFNMAKNMGADCIITGDTTYHFVSDYNEIGITVIDAGHFNTENLVYFDVMKGILNDIPDIQIILSEKGKDVYDIL